MFSEVINSYICKNLPALNSNLFDEVNKTRELIFKPREIKAIKNNYSLPICGRISVVARVIGVSITTVYNYLDKNIPYVDKRNNNSYMFYSI